MWLLLAPFAIIFIACLFLPTPPPKPGQPLVVQTGRKPSVWDHWLWCDRHDY